MRKCKRLLLLLCAAALLAGLTAVLAAAETDGWQLTLGPTNPDLTEETDNDQYSNEAPLYIYNADFNGDASEVGYLHTSDAFLRYKYFITFAPVVGTDCYKAVQAGNNLVADWEENSVAIPEGGFVLVFYYQANPDNVADHTSPNDNNTAAYEPLQLPAANRRFQHRRGRLRRRVYESGRRRHQDAARRDDVRSRKHGRQQPRRPPSPLRRRFRLRPMLRPRLRPTTAPKRP